MIESLSLLSVIILLPFVGMLFALSSKSDENLSGHNAFNVAVFTVCANLVLILRIFYNLDISKSGLQLVERFNWLENPNIDIILGADVFSVIIIMAVHLAFVIGLYGIKRQPRQKPMVVFGLLFLSLITGFFLAADIFSFYIFFEAMLFPLFMLIGIYGNIRRDGVIYRFFLYNFLGSVVLFLAVIILYNHQEGQLEISRFGSIKMDDKIEYFMLTSIFISFLSRIPIWPFHYWISSISSNIRNPLVFIITNILPLTGIYGFMRFLPNGMDVLSIFYISALEIIAVITMVFIALIGFTNRDAQYKFFSYITVYYIMYLLALLNHDSFTEINIAFSCFSYLIVIAALEFLSDYLYFEQEEKGLNPDGILCSVPRISFVYSFFILAAVGLPVSSLFVNNFLIVSNLMSKNLNIGLLVVVSLTLVSGALLKNLYRLKDRSRLNQDKPCIADIRSKTYGFLIIIMMVLLMSSFKPLWFLEM